MQVNIGISVKLVIWGYFHLALHRRDWWNRGETEAVGSYILAHHSSMTTSNKSICSKTLLFKTPTKNSLLNYHVFNLMPEHQLVFTQASGVQRHPFRETLCRAQKPKFWKINLVPPAVTPSPDFSSYLARAAISFMGPAASCRHLGNQKFHKLSVIITFYPAELTLHLQYFANRRKLKGGRDCLWIATYMR